MQLHGVPNPSYFATLILNTMVTWLVPLCLVCGSSQLDNKLGGGSYKNTESKSPSRWTSSERGCEDLYDRYCRALTADRCYQNYNQKLCCESCSAFSALYAAPTPGCSNEWLQPLVLKPLYNLLKYGESGWPVHVIKVDSFSIRVDVHTYTLTDLICLRNKCEEVSPSVEGDTCAYGNRNKNCAAMDSNKCYDDKNRFACCRKCAGVRTDMSHCRYGDKDVHRCSKIKPYHCYKEEVRQVCCGSCAKYYTGRAGCEYGDHVKLITRSRKRYNCAAYTAHFGYARCKLPWEKSFQEGCCGSCYDAFNGQKMRRYPYYFSSRRY